MVPSVLGTGTTGAAYSLQDTFSKIPSDSNLSNSLSKANGTGQALQNLGTAFGFNCRVTSNVFI